MSARWIQAALLMLLALLALALARLHVPDAPAWPGPAQLGLALLAVLGYICVFGLLPLAGRARGAAVAAGGETLTDAAVSGQAPVWIVHASQTGFAEQLAGDTCDALRLGGRAARCMPLQAFAVEQVPRSATVLLVASTTGEGDPPDAASSAAQALLASRPDLAGIDYAMLALGDRRYARFCHFARQLDAWLARCGARALFPMIEVDQGNEAALQAWRASVAGLCAVAPATTAGSPGDATWVLRSREHTNPGSPGAPVFALSLECVAAGGDQARPRWQAGDIAVVRPGPPGAPTVPGLREYSIASAPGEGVLRLLVRQVRDAEGRLGPGSGWLSEQLRPGDPVALRIRANPAFRIDATDAPLILIGNGTGLAGLRAHLAQRVANGRTRNWLLFGERDPASDLHFDRDLLAWEAQGFIEHLDLVFSRAGADREYVQRRLATHADRFREWIEEGASVLVCGSLHGMAPGVHAVIEDLLGAARTQALADAGRYRRDVY